MPISATGPSSKKVPAAHAGNRPDHRTVVQRSVAGFTLIELLVVLLIIGIMLGAIGFSMDARERKLSLEAERLLALLRMAQQETLLTADEAAVAFHTGGYIFLRREGERWLPVREGVYRPRFLEEDMQLSLRFLEDGAGPVPLLSLDRGTGIATDADFAANSDDLPRIYFFSGGELTPFELSITLASGAQPMVIHGDIQGHLRFIEEFGAENP